MENQEKITLVDLERTEENCLTPQQVADALGVSRKTFMRTVKNEPETLGFPIVKVGKKKIRIPKIPFLNFMRGKNK